MLPTVRRALPAGSSGNALPGMLHSCSLEVPMRALWLLLLVGCTGDVEGTDDTSKGATEDDSGGGGGGNSTVSVRISSPEDGATFNVGEAIDFVAKGKKDGESADIKSATWTIGDVTKKGEEVTIDDLPAGDWVVEVEATIGSKKATDSISITVKEVPPMNYEGRANIDLHLDHPDYGEYDDGCDGPLTFTLTGNSIAGSGTCTEELFGETFTFTLNGTLSGGHTEGNLVLTADGNDYATPFTGTGKYGEPFASNFDYTHSYDGATLRVYGTWNANPQ